MKKNYYESDDLKKFKNITLEPRVRRKVFLNITIVFLKKGL